MTTATAIHALLGALAALAAAWKSGKLDFLKPVEDKLLDALREHGEERKKKDELKNMIQSFVESQK